MIETITPAVCGSRKRQRLALGIFAAAAVAAAALLGAVLALAGAALGAREAVVVAAILAALAAAREAGVVRLPLPQSRSQVPERWRSELPLPAWAAAYGAGLGVGVLTFQPVATFWVACAAALVLGKPLLAAACFSLYGVGRALMVAFPTRKADGAASVERLAGRRRAVVRTNAAVLAASAVALAIAAPAAAAPLYLGPGSQLDPSLSDGVLAYTQREGVEASVVVRVSAAESYTFPSARSPSLDERFLAYEEADGVRVVRWRTGDSVYRAPGGTRPALEWPWLAYRMTRYDGARELWLTNLSTGATQLLVTTGPRTDIGRASISGGRVAWHMASASGSRIALVTIRSGKRSVLARSKIGLLAHPSLGASHVVWVDQRMGSSLLRLRRLDSTTVVTLARSDDRNEVFWTTAVAGRDVYVTRWLAAVGLSEIERVRF
jgi:hypothetical protein